MFRNRQVTPQGKRAYFVYYRTEGGTQRRPFIGEHGTVTAEQARDIARQWLAKVAAGDEGSIEFKHQNISAVLRDIGRRYIKGYKPRGNYQTLLASAVCDYLDDHPDFHKQLEVSSIAPAVISDAANVFVPPPPFGEPSLEPADPRVRKARRGLGANDARNRALGIPATLTNREMLVRTSVQHELRHHHDCLLSFTFFDVLRRKTQLARNAYYLFQLWKDAGGEFIVVPLLDWAFVETGVREAFLRDLAEFNGAAQLPVLEIPVLEMQGFEITARDGQSAELAFLRVCIKDALSIRNMLRGVVPAKYTGGMRPADIYELGAVAGQIMAAINIFGIEAARDFYFDIFETSYYGGVLSTMSSLLLDEDGSPRIVGEDVLLLASAIALWCVSAAPPDGPSNQSLACPIFRYLRLMSVLSDRSSPVFAG